MTAILAIETSSELASTALLLPDRVIAHDASGVHTHSQSVLPMVQTLLKESGITLAQCDAIAFGSGPGSFTGVRTACGIAQGLAFGSDLPVVPIVTLLAMAQACRDVCGADEVAVVLDARMGEVYWAQYRYADEWQTVIEPRLSLPAEVVPQGDAVVCGNGLDAYAPAFAGIMTTRTVQPNVTPHAVQVAKLANIAFTKGQTVAARDAQPLYLRNKVALTTVERLAKVPA
jgi:tRNA threonylcarbamoyladenosine biosynthesis protein TsaB